VAAAESEVTAPALAHHAPRAVASVIGGGAAPISRFPFQVALYDPELGRLSAGFFCGGVIVDAIHVITAAHCLAGTSHSPARLSREVAVLAGSTNLDPSDPGSVHDPAVSVSIDPHYNPTTNDYDIGVVTLARPLWTGAATPSISGAGPIAPLPIERVAAEIHGEPNGTPAVIATVSGWGDTSPASGAASYPMTLRSVRVPLVSEGFCQEAYASIELTITPRMICACSSRPRADSCFGDSGGPLVVDRDNPARPPGDYVLVGLVDFGDGCALPGFAGVYTRIADPAIAHYLATDIGSRAKAAGHRGRKKKRRHH
jgi:trypsin